MPLSLKRLPICKLGAAEGNMSGPGGGSSPKSVVRDSAASRKSLVGMALSLLAWTGTSSKVLWSVSNQVPPEGKGTLCGTAMILSERTPMASNSRWRSR